MVNKGPALHLEIHREKFSTPSEFWIEKGSALHLKPDLQKTIRGSFGSRFRRVQPFIGNLAEIWPALHLTPGIESFVQGSSESRNGEILPPSEDR
jgi:hypothetical protein